MYNLPPDSHNPEIRQLFVPGRGIEMNDSEYAGSVVYNSAASGDAYDRVVKAVGYTMQHQNVEQTIFVGNCTFAAPREDVPLISEAEAMAYQAELLGLSKNKIKLVPTSDTTFTNLWEARHALAPSIENGRPIGLVAQENHMDRIAWMGKIVLPDAVFEPIYADDPSRSNYEALPNRNDKIAGVLYRLAMIGVKPGVESSMMWREKTVKSLVKGVLNIARFVQKSLAQLRSYGRRPLYKS